MKTLLFGFVGLILTVIGIIILDCSHVGTLKMLFGLGCVDIAGILFWKAGN